MRNKGKEIEISNVEKTKQEQQMRPGMKGWKVIPRAYRAAEGGGSIRPWLY